MNGDCHTGGRADTGERGNAAVGTRVPADTLLDAAHECVLTAGVRRTTLSQIARTAGVSRMTLYRRFPDVDSALAALMTREFGTLLRRVRETAAGGHARERLVRGTVTAVRTLADEPLLRAVLDRDAEVILPYVVHRLGSTQRHAEEFIAEMIESGNRDGSIRHGERGPQVRTVLLLAQSFALSLRPASADMDATALLAELEHTLHAALLPDQEKENRPQ